MRLLVAFLLLSIFASSTAVRAENELSRKQNRDGWISLFDGKTMFGWQPTSEADWQVKGGTLKVTSGKPGFLMTTTEFADYELHVEFKAPATTNSGIFLRTPLQPKDPAKDCYEVNIAPIDDPYPTGAIVARKKWETDGEWSAYPPPGFLEKAGVAELDLFEGKWHSFDIIARGKNVKIKFDGHLFHEYEDPEPRLKGHIGLQFRKGEIEFRNIRLKPLGTKSIFNSRNLAGWNTDHAESSRFEVTPRGELRVLDGRGQIESEQSYGDFLLQWECYVNGDALNSGVFFRCIPRDFMMGYECQIQNGMIDGDPTKPQDCGTGGFFRRQNARRIVANDHEWFSVSLVADGPHMAAWVNGYQVSDWTDTRKPHENPRKGLRLEPGTLAIQGHDVTTDLRFRKIKIVELPGE